MRFPTVICAVMVVVLLGIPLAFDLTENACAQEPCCCPRADGTICCTYDLNCLGCPCAY